MNKEGWSSHELCDLFGKVDDRLALTSGRRSEAKRNKTQILKHLEKKKKLPKRDNRRIQEVPRRVGWRRLGRPAREGS